MIQKNFYNHQELINHIKSGVPTLYHSSQTSTVIPFEKLETLLGPDTVMGNLSPIKGSMRLLENGDLEIHGFVTWKEAKDFCRTNGREIMTSPTEELAGVLSGIATSATGERSFGYKNLRSQIVSLNYLNFKGEETKLFSNKKINCELDLTAYSNEFLPYKDFKNAPFPRLEFETDLMTGTEGQLGIITSCVLKTIQYAEETYLFILLPKWELNFLPHLEIFNAIQAFRKEVRACEFIDSNSLSYLPVEKNPGKNQDVLFLEIQKVKFDYVYEELISKLTLISEENIFEMIPSKCRDLRMSVPRAIFEVNTRMGVTKKGTDVQVKPADFENLLNFYKDFSKLGVDYNLFGHFGDAHLHFNFMPTKDKENFCNAELEKLYEQVKIWQGSPFAEHGIGLIKKKFIKNFYNDEQRKIFKELKRIMDPKNQFFKEGFMSC